MGMDLFAVSLMGRGDVMATKQEMQDLLNAMVNHEMERSKDALSEAYWTTGAAMISFDDNGLVVKPIAYGDMYEPTPSASSPVSSS